MRRQIRVDQLSYFRRRGGRSWWCPLVPVAIPVLPPISSVVEATVGVLRAVAAAHDEEEDRWIVIDAVLILVFEPAVEPPAAYGLNFDIPHCASGPKSTSPSCVASVRWVPWAQGPKTM